MGDLSIRKGFPQVVAAWQQLKTEVPDATFTIVGRGAMIDRARDLAARDPRVGFVSDPPRQVIHDELRSSSVVVLPSQPMGGWREQVGLPIVEGLAHGCSIVSTQESGIASWLVAHGHVAFPAAETATRLGPSVRHMLEHPNSPSEVLQTLPAVDGRAAADRWLFDDGSSTSDRRLMRA